MAIPIGTRVAPAPNRAQPRQGTGFTNIQRLLQKPTRLTNEIGGRIGQAAGSATNALNQAGSEFQTGLQANRLGTEEQDQQRQALQEKALQGTAGNISDEEAAQYAKFRGGQYGGPQGYTNEGQVTKQAQEAEALGQGAKTQTGREGLLQRFAANPQSTYTAGQRNLDLLALGGAGNKLRQIAQTSAGLGQRAQAGALSANEQAKTAGNEAAAFGQKATTGINTSEQAVQDEIAKQQATMQGQAESDNARYERLRSGGASAEDVQALGLDPSMNTYGANVGEYLQNAANPTLGNAINDKQRNQLSALSKLAGVDANTVLGQYNQDEMGKYAGGKFDQGGFQGSVAQRKQEYTSQSNAIQQAQGAKTGYQAALQNPKLAQSLGISPPVGNDGQTVTMQDGQTMPWIQYNQMITNKLKEAQGALDTKYGQNKGAMGVGGAVEQGVSTGPVKR